MKRPWFIHLFLLLALAGIAGTRIWKLHKRTSEDAMVSRVLAAAHPVPDWCAYQLYDWRDRMDAYRCAAHHAARGVSIVRAKEAREALALASPDVRELFLQEEAKAVGSLRMLAVEHADPEIEWLAKEWGR